MEQLTIGNYTLTWLRGGVTHLDGGAMFGVVPKPLWSKKYPVNDKNQIELRSDPILIQGNGKNILIEAGLGIDRFTEKQKRNFGITEESFVDEDLHALGLTSADIDEVLMTHMHYDHAAGLVKWEDSKEVPAFENAVIYLSETEWEETKNPNIRSANTYWKQNWKPVEHMVKTFQEERTAAPGIVQQKTGGHSKGMCIITIEQNDDMLIHMADNMGTHAHQPVLWVMAYDDYPIDSIAMKQKFMDIGCNNEAWFTFYHDYKYRAIQLDSAGLIQSSLAKKNEI
ncbi:glyoxylase-like metal-dependent hydrolase (beta-lactamase superfamily II) [Salibacterium salarium]|uniref:YtnP family quorum-quenching lactonase n=1 Tax=Salibacterium salarium TaxID=284579 RepID=UPI00277F5FB0|nr:MBL fold metallo-hydrolase [Salibacterium salarium]MDQ0298519.1 glyoxylase-like metal-dependent hydrolase (beta-lactamase superfamily II) [Salibacterium salarium]